MDHAVVLAGGSGTRFWPESRRSRSKQFLDLTGEGPMVAATVRRLAPLFGRGNVWIVAGEKDARHLSPRALGVAPGRILLEPEGRNTAPAVALAAAAIARKDPEAVVAATPADHAVGDPRSFRAALARALRLARGGGRYVTIGIPPTRPATGYGYIERGSPLPGDGAFRVRRFTEKPALAAARRFVRSGRYYWNSGIFVFRARTYRESLARLLPDVEAAVSGAFRAYGTAAFPGRLRAAWRRIPPVSVDYGIMEKEEGILVVPGTFGWSDLGTWMSLHEYLGGPTENVATGRAVLSGCRGCLVRTDRGVVAVLGMTDTVVVRSGDAVLVFPRERAEEVKKVAEEVARRFPDFA